MKRKIIIAIILILGINAFAQESQPPGKVEEMVSTDPDLFKEQPSEPAPAEQPPAAEQQPDEGQTPETPAGEQTPTSPSPATSPPIYGKFTYNSRSNTYSEGSVTYNYDPASGTYTTTEGKNAYGQTSFTAFNPRTGQEVVYVEGQPTYMTTYDSEGIPTTKEITKDSDEYRSFLGGGSDPTPAYSPTAQTIGGALKLYNEYKGLAAYTSLIPGYSEWVQQNRERLQREFCIALGLKNCIASTLCRQIVDVRADNVAIGIGPTGEYVSSAAITAERSPALEVAGMTKQQLIDLFGANTTTIAGRTVNLADPNFDPATLGTMQIRMYHVQFGITNNAETGRTTAWNLEFRTPTGISRRWYPQDQLLPYRDTASGHTYKLSATEYKEACIVSDTGLSAGKYGATPTYIHEFCRDFVEYAGGPESIAGAAAPAAPTTAAGTAGGSI